MYGYKTEEEEAVDNTGNGGDGGTGAGRELDAEAKVGDRDKGREDTVEGSKPAGYVYFIVTADERFVKIGYSAFVMNRLKSIGTIGPGTRDLRLIGYLAGTMATEKELHKQFVAYRDVGEWFHYADEIRKFAKTLLPPPEILKKAGKVEGLTVVSMKLPTELLREIEVYRHEHQFASKVAAFEHLLRYAVKANPPKPEDDKR